MVRNEFLFGLGRNTTISLAALMHRRSPQYRGVEGVFSICLGENLDREVVYELNIPGTIFAQVAVG